MREPHIEGVATHDDPESCVHAREGVGEALTGAGAGWVFSREKKQSWAPTPLAMAEGNTDSAVSVRRCLTRRGRSPGARTEPSCDFVVRFQHEHDTRRSQDEPGEQLRVFVLELDPEKTKPIPFERFARAGKSRARWPGWAAQQLGGQHR